MWQAVAASTGRFLGDPAVFDVSAANRAYLAQLPVPPLAGRALQPTASYVLKAGTGVM